MANSHTKKREDNLVRGRLHSSLFTLYYRARAPPGASAGDLSAYPILDHTMHSPNGTPARCDSGTVIPGPLLRLRNVRKDETAVRLLSPC